MKRILLAAVATIFLSTAAHAEQDEFMLFLGPEGGYQVHGSNKTSLIGGVFGARFGVFTIGAFMLHTKLQSFSFGLGNVDTTQEYYGGEAGWVFSDMIRAGLRVGTTKLRAKGSINNPAISVEVTSQESYLFAGPVAGLDFHFVDEFSIGPQLSYLLIFTPGTSTKVLHAEATFKFWF